MKMIVGRIHLGKKIDINTWKEQYKTHEEVCEGIDDFLQDIIRNASIIFSDGKGNRIRNTSQVYIQFCMSSNVLLFG